MTTDDVQVAARQLEDLGHEHTQLAIADDRHALAWPDVHTVGDLHRRRQRFDEHRLRIGDGIRQAMQIASGERQILGHGAVTLENPQDRALAAMCHITAPTEVAGAVSGVDFADNTAAIGQDAHKFMAEYPTIAHITFSDFDVRVANTSAPHLHQYLSRRRYRHRIVIAA